MQEIIGGSIVCELISNTCSIITRDRELVSKDIINDNFLRLSLRRDEE